MSKKLIIVVALSIAFSGGAFFNAHAECSNPPTCGPRSVNPWPPNSQQYIWLRDWLEKHKSEPGYEVGLKGENTWERDRLNPPNTPY